MLEFLPLWPDCTTLTKSSDQIYQIHSKRIHFFYKSFYLYISEHHTHQFVLQQREKHVYHNTIPVCGRGHPVCRPLSDWPQEPQDRGRGSEVECFSLTHKVDSLSSPFCTSSSSFVSRAWDLRFSLIRGTNLTQARPAYFWCLLEFQHLVNIEVFGMYFIGNIKLFCIPPVHLANED